MKHDPEAGKWGDCFRCCVASIMDLDRHEVPHFMDQGVGPEGAFAHVRDWLSSRGLALAWVNFMADDVGVILEVSGIQMPDVPLIFCGLTQGGTPHANVAHHGKLQMDAGALVTQPMPDGDFHVFFIAKAAPNER